MTAPASVAPGAAIAPADEAFGPWNPGIAAQLPRELLPLSTMFRPENARTRLADAEELHDLTGLDLFDLVAFRPERLALHELLIRVTADVSVPSGSRVEDLGINFRKMVNTLLTTHIAPRTGELVAAYDTLRQRLASVIDAELSARIFPSARPAELPARHAGIFARLFGSRRHALEIRATASVGEPEDAIDAWRTDAHAANADPMRGAAYHALARVVGSLVGRHGGVWGTKELIASLATDVACNEFCSEEIGRLIEPWLVQAAHIEGYRLLPAQARPVIMNTKGASAAGKSTMRPEQQTLAARIGVEWTDFALISPDIWRKQLLDYSSLGAAYKYGGACTSHELEIIDHKLDRYMARKAGQRATSHLLIDRFRFDSFAPESDEAGSNLLTRFGHTIYLFFVVTPPEAIVERAWQRGLDVGRYKAVDDLLAHNIEAYAGMPEIFFTWALSADKEVHCEFLDNTVPLGERPRTIAFGWNGELNVLDVKAMLDIERFRKVDVNATGPDDLYADRSALAPENNSDFLVECARRLATLNFADQATGRIYLQLAGGAPLLADAEALRVAMADPDTRAGLLAVAPAAATGTIPQMEKAIYLEGRLGAERIHTLGRWGWHSAGNGPSSSPPSRS